MVDTVKTRRTNYEVLGLEPTATSDEIEQAFAAAIGIFRPHRFGGVAEATVAYRTLSDPARRRAYDVEIGLGAKPDPRPAPMSWRVGGQFMTATATPVMRPVIGRPALPEPQVEARPPVEQVTKRPAEPAATPFIAATLHELASPEPLRERLEARARAQPEVKPSDAPKAVAERRVDLALDDGADEPEAGVTPWKAIGIVVGALAAVVALFGAWVGWDSVSSAEPVENSAKAALPPPTTYIVGDPAAAAHEPVLDEARSLPPKRTARAAPRVERKRASSPLAGLEQQLAAASPTPAPDNPAAPAEDATPAAPAATAASMPLSNGTIARTIARIGYPCGSVASTSQILGQAFTVTCTSGHKYRAAPVRGRYHFRRLSGG